MEVSWKPVDGAVEYILLVYGSEWARTETPSWVIVLETGGTYELRVVAVDTIGALSPPSESITLIAEERES